jgi:hypothetical protein
MTSQVSGSLRKRWYKLKSTANTNVFFNYSVSTTRSSTDSIIKAHPFPVLVAARGSSKSFHTEFVKKKKIVSHRGKRRVACNG